MGASAAYLILFCMGFMYFIVAYLTNRIRAVDSTHTFVIADRKIGLGVGVGALIAAWTYAVAIMMSAGSTFNWGFSALWWFVWPNGFSVMLVIPFARRLRRILPHGYTIPEFARLRFDTKNHVLYYISMIYLMIVTLAINIKGLSVAFSTLFGVDWLGIAIIATLVVALYCWFGGIWTVSTTGVIQTFFITVVPIVLIFVVLSKVGVGFLYEKLAEAPPRYRNVLDYKGLIEFGLLFALGCWAQILTDQMFWQKAWSYRRKYMEKIFMLGGILFYPIPIALGILGLIGYALGADTVKDLGGDWTAVGPWVLQSLKIAPWLIALYATMVLSASFSTVDACLTAVSSVAAVDIIKQYKPNISSRALFMWTKVSIVITAVLGILILLSKLPMIKMWLVVFGLGSARCVPFLFAVFWRKTNRHAAFWAVIIGAAVALPAFFTAGYFGLPPDASGFFAAIGISFIITFFGSLIKPEDYDFNKLKEVEEILE